MKSQLYLFVTLFYLIATSSAQTVIPLSVARTFVGAASAKQYAVFSGGWNSGGASNAVDIYHSPSSNWTVATLDNARYNHIAVGMSDRVLIAGGQADENTFFTSVEAFVVDTNNQISKGKSMLNLSVGRSFLAAASINDIVLFAGGSFSSSYNKTAVVDIYNSTSGTITTSPSYSLSVARHRLSGVSVGQYILFAGGEDSIGASKVVDVYRYQSSVLEKLAVASLGQERYSIAATSLKNQLALFAGGVKFVNQDFTAYNTIDVFDATTGQFTTSKTLATPSWNSAAVSYNGIAYFAGGTSSETVYLPRIEQFEMPSNSMSLSSLSLVSGTDSPAGTIVDNSMIFVGGSLQNGTLVGFAQVFTLPIANTTTETMTSSDTSSNSSDSNSTAGSISSIGSKTSTKQTTSQSTSPAITDEEGSATMASITISLIIISLFVCM